MRYFIILLFQLCMIFNSHSQNAELIVQQQLEAYNARDIEAFMSVFHQDIELFTLGIATPTVIGFEKVKDIYKDLFENSPELHSKIINRTVIGNKVIDHEQISGRRGSKEDLFLVMIYDIEDGKIRRAWAIRE